ncbi:MAG: ABC transporter permease [Oscillospiraceae bacterium]|nr:ABC transporter permease [Oscillospiraceae bacterium]
MNTAQKILLTVNILILMTAAVVLTVIFRLNFLYASDNLAEQWEKESGTKYSQVSVFLPFGQSMSIPDTYGRRYSIETKLKNDNTIEKTDTREWADCASAEMTAKISHDNHDLEVVMTGTWGDFFLFHPEELVSGSYYSGDDININRAVIDDMAAWSLFGSVDASEMTFYINDIEFEVAGVVRSPIRADDQIAYGTKPHIYLPIEAISYINEVAYLSTYEMCVPYRVDGYATEVAKNEFTEQAEIVDQTGRFDIVKLVKGFKSLPESVMVKKGFIYPWFENSVRAAELKARMLAFPTAIVLIISAVSLVYLLFVTAKAIGRFFRFIAGKLDDVKQKKLRKEYEKRRSQTV